jgi:ABC-type transport system substrate-binding protein
MEHPLVGGYAPDKVALRRAIALGFDAREYIRSIYSGYGVLAQSPFAPGTFGYDPAYRTPMSEYDPARARALLDVYGYVDRDGDGWRETPQGEPLELEIASTSTQRDRSVNELWSKFMNRLDCARASASRSGRAGQAIYGRPADVGLRLDAGPAR